MTIGYASAGRRFVSAAEPWDQQRDYFLVSDNSNQALLNNGEFGFVDISGIPADVRKFRPTHGSEERKRFDAIDDYASKLLGESSQNLPAHTLTSSVAARTKEPQGFVEVCLRMLVADGTLSAQRTKTDFLLGLSANGKQKERQRSFAASFAHELTTQAERIAGLVSHRLTVGTYREELLRELLQRHIPQRFRAATGFILGIEQQLDIIIYDAIDHAPIFQTGNLVVVPPESVRAIIEVKSSLTPAFLRDALDHLDGLQHVPGFDQPPAFTGVFAFTRPGTSEALLDVLDEYYRDDIGEEDDLEKKGMILKAVDPIDAVCVLKSDLFSIDYATVEVDGGTRILSPVALELENSSEREFQASWFFARLSQYLRYPFDGQKTGQGLGGMMTGQAIPKAFRLMNGADRWSMYTSVAKEIASDAGLDDPAKTFEAEWKRFSGWLAGNKW
ncbi:hypothetical protein ELI49_30950 (plasmid) [Rhizobium ruizarguesonis]|uniref:DUF6602 domain-containing protein n=2 Tax=Rhizobium TaxID=379 RepID=A0AAE8TYY6_9HYPH|nr:DUF6602 domain-containing protein [Rhizobium ruizarguesonis]NEH89138.1 hypothetical protein [Rhizobium ruizarguesonis]NEJ08713.1 hypothetical protein [Rhizobium ruizarguesonis]NEJ18228.1 hypothetical protein [Rhizobium ruizarguesonis]NEJ59372.1 hypothetical protein [Rhizobium ruizarguesonis]NEJ66712.1 hypothetical protein [Rhizobium ruizarguesonis]